MRKLIVTIICISLTACATVPDQKPDDMKTVKLVVGTVALIAIAGALGKANQQSKCANNSAGFWVDNINHKVYTCP